MEFLLLWIARVFGLGGVALCAVAVASRFAGVWHVGSYSIGTLLQGGMTAMVLACLCYAALIGERARR